MKTFLKVRSEYFEHDSSKYRLGVTLNTLIPSLQNQTKKDFHIVLDMSPMDPFWTKRWKAFKTCGAPVIQSYNLVQETPALEIEVGDDDFLCGSFIEVLQRIPQQEENTALLAPNGFIFSDGELHVWNNRENVVDAVQWVTEDPLCHKKIVVSTRPGWIYVRHNMNSSLIQGVDGGEIRKLNWPGWAPNLVDKVSKIRVVTASAMGCELHPFRASKSIVFAKGSARKRRKGR